MNLIFSEKNDSSTTQVIEWLHFFKIDYIRVNETDEIEIIIKNNEFYFIVDNIEIELKEVKFIWYRRPTLKFKRPKFNLQYFDNLLNIEFNKIIELFVYKLIQIQSLGNIKTDVNKLIVTDLAKNIGLLTTDDYLITNKEGLLRLHEKSEIISKVISGHSMYNFEGFTAFNYTSMIENIENIPETFFPSLVQNYIEKKYELRVYYQKESFYTMAIISQNDKKTEVDFRNYNNEKPNRTLPYKLPHEIEMKIIDLMKKIGLDNGSIDLIVTPNNEYVFLEVNPVGQFGMTSYPTNYNIEKFIALLIKSYENK
jgi:ATP-GRASP peptide maturase of grasp-with-spasm system